MKTETPVKFVHTFALHTDSNLLMWLISEHTTNRFYYLILFIFITLINSLYKFWFVQQNRMHVYVVAFLNIPQHCASEDKLEW